MLMITTACPLNVNYWRCCNTIFWIFDSCQFVRLLLITIPMMMIPMMTWDEMRTEKLVIGRKLSLVQPRAHGSLMSQFMLLSSTKALLYR